MRWQPWVLGLACTSIASVQAAQQPLVATDYYSLQIASSSKAQALESLYQNHLELPFVRIEQRGTLYVLRAGFWSDRRTALAAMARLQSKGGFVRTAVFKPDAIVRRNWLDETLPQVTPAARVETVRVSQSVVSAPSQTVTEPFNASDFRPFHQADFALAYDALLGNRDMEGALRIAQQAVRVLPQDAAWRRRLARVAEWTQHPALAAEQWQVLFSMGDRAADTVAAVIRLASVLESPLTAVQAWEWRAQRSPLTARQWLDLYQLYDDLSEPQRGSLFLEAQYKATGLPLLLEYAAALAEHGGDVARAQALSLQRLRLEPFSMAQLLRAIVNFIRLDQLAEALALMKEYQARVPADAAEYWRLLAQVAWLQGDYVSAQGAYRAFAPNAGATVEDWSRLVFLVRQQHPAQAAELAWAAYRRFGDQDYLMLALELYAQVADFKAQGRVFDTLDPQALAKAQTMPRFLLLRAQYQRQQKRPDLAWLDLRQALTLNPKDAEVALSALWFLVDEKREVDLSTLMRQYHALALKDERFWSVYAAASLALERPRDAINWYRKVVGIQTDDPLMLLNYADALERSHSAGMALRVRRHAWTLLKKRYPHPRDALLVSDSAQLLAVARLALLNQPGDPSLQRVRELVTQLRDVPADESTPSQTPELVLGWAILKEQFPNARTWMWLQYARQTQREAPLWGQAQVALQLGDTAAMSALLSQRPSELPPYNRYDMTYALGHTDQALNLAFAGLSRDGDDEPLYDRFRQHAPAQASYLQFQVEQEGQGSFDSKSAQLKAGWALTPKLKTTLSWSRTLQSSAEPALTELDGAQQLQQVELDWQSDLGLSRGSVFRHRARQTLIGLRLGQTVSMGYRTTMGAGLDYRVASTLSQPMRLAGYESNFYTSVNYALGRREYLRATPRLSRYYTIDGDLLGSGRGIGLEAGYRLRTEYPDWVASAFWSHQSYSYGANVGADGLSRLSSALRVGIAESGVDAAHYFIPGGSAEWGACLSMGENLAGQSLQTGYSRAWRAFGSLCLRHNTLAGDGYNGAIGWVGSLTGEDHLWMQWQRSSGTDASSVGRNQLSIRYRHYF